MASVNKVEPFVFEVLEKVKKQRHKDSKIKILKENDNWAVKDVLGGIYDDNIKWNIPTGAPPYKPSEEHNAPTNLRRKHTELKYFVVGGPGDKMPTIKRETMFIGFLEAIHPKDAELIIRMIAKEKIEGITKNIVKEAFPGLPIT